MNGSLRGALVALSLAVTATLASAGIPAAYAPIVIEATGLPERAEFDLGPALQRAQRENKRLYVYLGASDCPYCRRYEEFLQRNAAELAPRFVAGGYLVVDLRSALRYGGQVPLHFKAGGRSQPYADFQQSIGDERARRLVYPSVWLFDARGKTLMQMPAGTGTFQTVPEQIEILELVE
jgi:thioredoxin-related protein